MRNLRSSHIAATVCSSRRFKSSSSILLAKVNVVDLAKGVSPPELPEVSTLDQNWFQFAKTIFVEKQAGKGSLGDVDAAAKERIMMAQRESALSGLPPIVRQRLDQKGISDKNTDLSKFKTVKETLDAADPNRPHPQSFVEGDSCGVERHPLGESLDNSLDAPDSVSSSPAVAPSLSITPTTYGTDTVVTPQQIRTMFKESVQARTVANTALRKYIKALNSRDYALAVAAYDGCREGGLRVDPETYSALLDLLLSAFQLRAGLELYQTMIREKNPPNTTAYNSLMRLCMERGAIDAALRLYDEMPSKGRSYDSKSHEIALIAISKQPHPVDWQKAVTIFERATAGTVDDTSSNTNDPSDSEGTELEKPSEKQVGQSASRRQKRRDLLREGVSDVDYDTSTKAKLVGGFTSGRVNLGTRATASTYNALMRVYLSMEPFEWRVVYNCYFEMRNSKPKIPITWESYRLVSEAMRRGEASRTRRVITYIDAWIQLTSIGSARFLMGFALYAVIIGFIKLVISLYFTDHLKSSQDVGINVEKELPVGHETIAVGLGGQASRVEL